MTPLRRNLHVLAAVCILASAAIVYRSWTVQVVEAEMWSTRADRQIVRTIEEIPRRGSILDRSGEPIALSSTRYEIGIASREVPGPEAMQALKEDLEFVLGLSPAEIDRLTDASRTWAVVPGRYGIDTRLALARHRGLHFLPQVSRVYPMGAISTPLLGRLGQDGQVFGGIESRFDDLLSGTPGSTEVYTDVRGQTRRARGERSTPAVPGQDVHLTLDGHLQSAAERILLEAIEAHEAAGGDLVVLDPRTGEVLAIAAFDGRGNPTLSAVGVPFEPGSTIKPFAVAPLMDGGHLSWSDTVDAEGGDAIIDGRRLRDVARRGRIDMLEAFAVSSNIVLAKEVRNLSRESQYGALKDFGFGAHTGIEVPGESAGLLRETDQWSGLSQASLAIGYEMSVTPIQLAAAYGAIANDGVLLRPTIVRSNGGSPDTASHPLSRGVAEDLRMGLAEVIETGSGRNAGLAPYPFGGKTGTSRAWGAEGYDGYFASFAGVFPAEQPQVVIITRIIRPEVGGFYGGAVAAPIARRLVEAILSQQNPFVEAKGLPLEVLKPWQVQGSISGIEPPYRTREALWLNPSDPAGGPPLPIRP